jgi:hypothetical protein
MKDIAKSISSKKKTFNFKPPREEEKILTLFSCEEYPISDFMVALGGFNYIKKTLELKF